GLVQLIVQHILKLSPATLLSSDHLSIFGALPEKHPCSHICLVSRLRYKAGPPKEDDPCPSRPSSSASRFRRSAATRAPSRWFVSPAITRTPPSCSTIMWT